MKQFEIPEYYRSPIITKVKAKRKLDDPRKKDFSPTHIHLDKVHFFIARHFGFCYGVENAIEIAYRAIDENPGKKIYLLSQMIHNPGVNEDLQAHGILFIQDTAGNQLLSWDDINKEDIVIIPAFGTTVETEQLLKDKGINVEKYNTTCPFVEKVWNRADKLGAEDHTIIIHGKAKHEETRATFSHSSINAQSLIIKDIKEAKFLSEVIKGAKSPTDFHDYFKGKYSEGFKPEEHLKKIGVVNQTTMLASETQEIAEFLKDTMIDTFGIENLKSHFADTRDTLCYATNDNQSATIELMQSDADIAIVVGGYNSSNTTHLVELLEKKFPCYFINSSENIFETGSIQHFDIHTKEMRVTQNILNNSGMKIALTSGASCPDSVIDNVIQKICTILNIKEVNQLIDSII